MGGPTTVTVDCYKSFVGGVSVADCDVPLVDAIVVSCVELSAMPVFGETVDSFVEGCRTAVMGLSILDVSV